MTDEEKKAKANLKYYINEDVYFNGTYTTETDFDKYCLEHCKDIDIVLQALEKKDKIIDLMAEQLTTPIHNKEWVEQYFENKVGKK